jgi:hypothetical protein
VRALWVDAGVAPPLNSDPFEVLTDDEPGATGKLQ